MSLYSVMLVDDEEEVIQIIMKKLDWASMGFQIVGYAHNGAEALELAEECQPDVVMTDIKMPYMDGLELSRRLKERYPSIRIIILSGFDEFEYAKEAIRIEVEEYILKPIDAGELQELFGRIKKSLDKEIDEKRNIDKLQEYYMESLPLLQENFFTSLFEGRVPAEEIDKYLVNYQIHLCGPLYLVTILHLSSSDVKAYSNPFLMTVSVKKLAEEQLVPKYGSRTLIYLGDIIVISQLETADQVAGYTDMMDEFCRQAKRVCGIRVTAGVGQLCSSVEELKLSYQGARNAVSYRALYGNNRAINIAEIEPKEKSEETWEEEALHRIMKQIRLGDKSALEGEVKDCLKKFTENGSSLQKYRLFVMELIAEIMRFGNKNQLDMEELFRKESDIYQMVFQPESFEELCEWLIGVGEKVQEMLSSERQNNTKSFVTRAVEYVRENYADQSISIETVCRTLGVSAAYFSTVFKKETGKTFIGYLTDYRMEAAEELLLTTDDKTYMIAEKVGYGDPNYFSYAFKKKYGVSPSKYRVEKMKVSG